MKSVALVLGFLFLAVFVGVFAGVMPWHLSVGSALLVVVVALAGRNAVVDLSVLLLVALGIVPIPGRSTVDALVLLMMAFLMLRSARGIGPMLAQHKQVIGWVGVIVVLGGVSLTYGVLVKHNHVREAYSDARYLLYWGMLPVCLVLLRERISVRAMVVTMAFFASLLGLVGVLQSVLGRRLLLSDSGRVEALQNTLSTYQDVTRSIVPGTALVSFAFFLALAQLLAHGGRVKRSWWWLVLALTAAGIVVNFGRALWVATVLLSLLLLVRAQSGRRAVQVLAVVCVLGAVSAAGLYVAKPVLFESIADRIVSSREEGRSSTSWSWRRFENQYAFKRIQSSPIAGVGMGGEYKPFQGGLGKFDEMQTVYIHNSYLFLPLKLGVPSAAIVFGVLVWLTLRMNRRVPASLADPLSRSVLLAAGASALQMMGMAFIQPQFNAFSGVLVFALLLALSETIHLRSTQQQKAGAMDTAPKLPVGFQLGVRTRVR